jgi:predicted Rossmann-fold nucleotide-binding protein
LAHHLSLGSLAGLTIEGLHLEVDPPDFAAVDVADAMFVGCRFADADTAAELVRRGASVVPIFEETPYPSTPSRLYTADDLAAGFDRGGYAGMYDTVVYEHFLAHGGALPDVREALAQRLHDTGVDAALATATRAWIGAHGATNVVGVMGGHAQPRGSRAYRLAATLAHRLAGTGRLLVTGGGPGVMEATNLGGYLAQRPEAELTAAVDLLSRSPDFTDHDPYTAAALAVRAANPPGSPHPAGSGHPPWSPQPAGSSDLHLGGLAIPTWLYGHEPANLFAAGIAKYFSNAIREDTILRLARGGIAFGAGMAGTVQEIFQAATKTFYQTDGPSGAFVFLGVDHWAQLPVEALLRPLLARSPHGDQSHLIVVTDSVDEALAALAAN